MLNQLGIKPIFLIVSILVLIGLIIGGVWFFLIDRDDINDNNITINQNTSNNINAIDILNNYETSNNNSATQNININDSIINNINNGQTFDLIDMSASDPDNDELLTDEENNFGTNPQNSDSDSDGFLDGSEVDLCFNPLGEGRMTTDIFLTYCVNNLSDELDDTSAEEQLQTLCKEWQEYAQEIINAAEQRVSSLDVVETYKKREKYTKQCTQVTSMSSGIFNDPSFEEYPELICDLLDIIAETFCPGFTYTFDNN